MIALHAVIAAIFAAVAAAGAAPAAHTPAPEGHWSSSHVYVHSNGVAGVARAVEEWDALSELRVTVQKSPCTLGEVACVEVAYGTVPASAAGIAVISAPRGVIASCRVVIGSTLPTTMPAEFVQQAIAHEVGHCLGLGHEPAASDSAMEDGIVDSQGGWHLHAEPTDLDRIALEVIYG